MSEPAGNMFGVTAVLAARGDGWLTSCGVAEVRTVGGNQEREQAAQPEDLGRFFVQRANAGDLSGR